MHTRYLIPCVLKSKCNESMSKLLTYDLHKKLPCVLCEIDFVYAHVAKPEVYLLPNAIQLE